MRLKLVLCLLCMLTVMIGSSTVVAQNPIVSDQAGVLSDSDIRQLEEVESNLVKRIPSLNHVYIYFVNADDRDTREISNELFENSMSANDMLITSFMDTHDIYLNVGVNLESFFAKVPPDCRFADWGNYIIRFDGVMAGYYRQADFVGGVVAALNEIELVMSDRINSCPTTASNPPTTTSQGQSSGETVISEENPGNGLGLFCAVLILVILVMLLLLWLASTDNSYSSGPVIINANRNYRWPTMTGPYKPRSTSRSESWHRSVGSSSTRSSFGSGGSSSRSSFGSRSSSKSSSRKGGW